MGIDELRAYALALPEVTEGTHFRLHAFQVKDKTFIVLKEGGSEAILHVDRAVARAAVVEMPHVCEEIWRNSGRIFVGVRVDLESVPGDRVRPLVEGAWRNKAPKRLVTAYDQRD